VLVLGDVGEMREIAERAHHLDRAVVRQAVEGGLELAARRGIALAAECDRDLADALDRGKRRLALLLADGVAEHPPDQADIVSQRPLSVRNLADIHVSPRPVAPACGRAFRAGLQEVRLTNGRKRARHTISAYFLDASNVE
jgi:hypothetical protein